MVAELAPRYRVERDSLVKISDTPDLTVRTLRVPFSPDV